MAKIVLLNGPPAAGKTSVAKQLIKTMEHEEWAYISHDDIRGLVESGHKSADSLRSGWDERTWEQWLVGAENCIDEAKNFSKHGISSLIDFYATKEEFEAWKKRLQGTEYKLIILLPDREAEIKRNESRQGPSHLEPVKMDEAIEEFKGWNASSDAFIIDNSKLSIEQTVAEIIRRIN